LLATLVAVANASGLYGLGLYGQPALRTSYSAPISALNAYPGAINAYAGAPLAATYAAAAPLIAAPYAAAAYAAPLAAAPLPLAGAVGAVSSQHHSQVTNNDNSKNTLLFLHFRLIVAEHIVSSIYSNCVNHTT
jgi:hypothetical protein